MLFAHRFPLFFPLKYKWSITILQFAEVQKQAIHWVTELLWYCSATSTSLNIHLSYRKTQVLKQHLPVISPLNHGSGLQKQNRLLEPQFKESQNIWTVFTTFTQRKHCLLTKSLPSSIKHIIIVCNYFVYLLYYF